MTPQHHHGPTTAPDTREATMDLSTRALAIALAVIIGAIIYVSLSAAEALAALQGAL